MAYLLDIKDDDHFVQVDKDVQLRLPLPVDDVVLSVAYKFKVGTYSVFQHAAELSEFAIDFEKDHKLYTKYRIIPLYALNYCKSIMAE